MTVYFSILFYFFVVCFQSYLFDRNLNVFYCSSYTFANKVIYLYQFLRLIIDVYHKYHDN